MPQSRTTTRYKPHPGLAMEKKARERLKADTGKTWDQWVASARKKGGSAKEVARRLKEEHGIAPMTAQWIAYSAVEADVADYGDPEPLVDALYSGEHAPLRSLHESLVDAMLELGDDVTVTACKTMVPVYRKHVFAELRPAGGAVEVRLALGDAPAKGRLKAGAAMPGDRLTHRVVVRAEKEIDGDLRRWIATAYDRGAEKMARSTEFVLPADLAKALRASKPASRTWESMTPAMRRDMAQWVTSAKQPETRARRLATAVEKLSSGKKRVY
jgi:hypothetical protein